ncbi:MAG: glycerophosphodiester phosphodiesterase family protein [Bacteroidota bacterium]
MFTGSVKYRALLPGLAFLLGLAHAVLGQDQEPVEQILQEFHHAESGKVLVAAHRAMHNSGVPENSLAAIRCAIEAGVDIVELDVRLTRDGIPVLMHDETIDRTTGGHGKVSDLSLAELREFPLKGRENRSIREPAPTLREALELARGKIMVDIDLKTDQVVPVLNTVIESGTGRQVFYFDNNYALLEQIRSLDSSAMLMPRAYHPEMADSALNLFAPQAMHIDHSFYTEELTLYIQNRGARVWINALGIPDLRIRCGNTRVVKKKLLKYGATILQTDEPEKLLTYLREEGLHD